MKWSDVLTSMIDISDKQPSDSKKRRKSVWHHQQRASSQGDIPTRPKKNSILDFGIIRGNPRGSFLLHKVDSGGYLVRLSLNMLTNNFSCWRFSIKKGLWRTRTSLAPCRIMRMQWQQMICLIITKLYLMMLWRKYVEGSYDWNCPLVILVNFFLFDSRLFRLCNHSCQFLV